MSPGPGTISQREAQVQSATSTPEMLSNALGEVSATADSQNRQTVVAKDPRILRWDLG